jgi:uracil-DNA glycosylase family 4
MIVNTEGPANAKIFLVGEAPGKDEDLLGRPFRGYAGKTLDKLLIQAEIYRAECLVGNVAREKPPANKISYFFEDTKCTIPKPKLQEWMRQLKVEIETYRPNVIVALGATALWALTGQKYISKYRGYVMESTLCPGFKVIPTYHPQNVNYEWKNYFPTVLDLRKAKFHSEFRDIPQDKRVLCTDVKLTDFIEYCRELLAHPEWEKVVLDVETVRPGTHIEILGLAHSSNFAMNIGLIKNKTPVLNENEEVELWDWVSEVLQKKKVIIHNAQFDDLVMLYNHGIKCNVYMDTLVAAHALWPELPRDLGYLGSLCLDIPVWKTTSSAHPYLYNAGDCAATYGIAEFFEKQLEKQGVRNTFDFEMKQIEVAEMMQIQGIEANLEIREQLSKECNDAVITTGEALSEILKIKVYDSLTKKSVTSSPKQLQKILYIDLSLPVQYKRRKHADEPKKITTDAEALKKLANLYPENPLLNLLLEHKKFMKLRKFIDVPLSPTNRAHTSYNITGKKDNKDDKKVDEEGRKSFGRWSSSESIILPYGSGNLQNVPAKAREMYAAPDGWEWAQGDLVQAEAVVVAYLTDDKPEKALFKARRAASIEEKSKFDVHRMTASRMFGIKLEEVTDKQRKVGKTLRHAISYDAGPTVIASRVGCSTNEAKRLKEMYHDAKPKLRVWYAELQAQLAKNRTLITPMGRKHKFLDRWGDDLFRSAYSFLPQSTVGDIVNEALVKLYHKYGHLFNITIQLHDAIYCMYPIEMREVVLGAMKECMTRSVIINNEEMVIEVDFKVGPSWGKQEDYLF